jgi:uncharacterized membrane protein HdeD (DUF308 family)
MSLTVFGVICIILGILAMMAPGITGLSIAMALGWLVAIGGIFRIIIAFQAGTIGRGLLRLLFGGLTLMCGIVLVNHPLFASGVLTVILALYFVLDGMSEILVGTRVGMKAGGGWLLFGGIVSLLLGIMIWLQFPLSGVWALGILLGIKLFFVGLTMVTVGSALRSAPKA